jgi:hypothetical protein
LLPSVGSDEKRQRQRRDNVTEAANSQRSGVVSEESSSTNAIEDGTRQSQHPVKKQIKFKRLRYLSVDQNGTKLVTDKLKSNDDTKDSAKRKITSTDSFFATTTAAHRANETKSNETADGGTVDGKNHVVSRSENTRTPSHRKKRRRIATSITALNAPRLDANSSRDNLSQYLDFGRKISRVRSLEFRLTLKNERTILRNLIILCRQLATQVFVRT